MPNLRVNMTVQAELIQIAQNIARVEPCTYEGGVVRWANTSAFGPGLYLEGHSRDNPLGRMVFTALELRTIAPAGEAMLHVSTNPDYADDYEDAYGEYFLQAFRAYRERPNFWQPVGIVGLSRQPISLAQPKIILS
jgi:hypothetical protein